ncbi:MAG TPA: MarR family transcriptional regulator [Candidatus Pseudomonas excrementavium]|uniref:MarR family winged helix-turn-helix transcriptional regulator n=1 Tax=Halopseudomonas bauzanensis TaxID=653930 RepID=UPI001C398144|nr:MarR family transcriptional regulator [Candidatus Pseudomonas excrementavium]
MHLLSQWSRFGIRFSMLSRLWRRTIDQKMAAAGLADISWSPLIHLDESGDGVSQKQLAALVGIDGSSLVRLLDTLESRGHIQRCPAPGDRRIKLVMLTAAGREAVTTIRDHLQRIEQEMLQDLDDRQLQVMMESFEIIQQRLLLMGASARDE